MAPGAAVVGTGFGCVTHVRALRAAGFEVRALVGRSRERTATRAAAFGVPHPCTSLEAALALDGVDVVTIATPPRTHAPLALEAIAAGRHVLCEKPLAMDASEARSLLDAADAAGIVHALGTEFRFDAAQATLARVVAAGAIGDPRLVTVALHVPSLASESSEMPAWWAAADEGGGWLAAHGSQVIDQIRVTAGEFAAVAASTLHVVPREMSADDGFVVQFRLRSGAAGVIVTTCADRGPILLETRVTGPLGTAWIDGLGPDVWVADGSGSRRVAPGADLPALRYEPLPDGVLETTYEQMIGHGFDLAAYTRLAEVLLARITGAEPPPGPPAATFADGVADMEVLDAVRRSAASRRWEGVGG